MKMKYFALILTFFACITLANTSCSSKKHLCPGLGQTNAADMSMFDEEGNLIEDKKKKRKKENHGLVNKKEPKVLHKRR